YPAPGLRPCRVFAPHLRTQTHTSLPTLLRSKYLIESSLSSSRNHGLLSATERILASRGGRRHRFLTDCPVTVPNWTEVAANAVGHRGRPLRQKLARLKLA